MKTLKMTVLALIPALALACSDPAADPAPVPTNITPDACGFAPAAAAVIDLSERHDVWHAGTYARVEAQIRASEQPQVHAVVIEEGGCRLLELMYGDCGPGCGPDEVCTSDNECAAEPAGLGAGVITVRGLGDDIALTSQSWAPGRYDSPSTLTSELFDAGDAVEVILDGGDFPAIVLGATGVAAMDTDLTASGYELTNGQDAVLNWTAGPDPTACVSVVLKGRNSVHGAPLGNIIECQTTDTGTLTIPQSIVEAFPIGQTPEVTNGFDWPHSELTRSTHTSLDSPYGPAVLTVRSTTYFQMSHTE